MPITLFAISYNQAPVSANLSGCFGPEGGTIGRADHNTLVLADPARRISRLQAEVVPSEVRFVIRNVGSARPIVIGERTLPLGGIAHLDHGQKVCKCAYAAAYEKALKQGNGEALD
jgi:FHA domain-containing protein